MSARRIIVILSVCLLVSVSLNLFDAGAFVALRSLDRSFGLGEGRRYSAATLAVPSAFTSWRTVKPSNSG